MKVENFGQELRGKMSKEKLFIIEDTNVVPNKTKFAICFSIDNSYAKYFSVVLQSFMLNCSKEVNYDIIVLFNDLSIENISRLSSGLPKNISLRFYNITQIKEKFIDKNKFKPRGYWSESMYFRLLIPEIFKNYEKVLYCDSDIIFNDNIDKIFSIDTEDKSLLVVLDSVAQELKYNKKRKKFIENELNIKKSSCYFNSGVILFNLSKIDNEKYFESLTLNLKNHRNLLFPDQDLLNIIFQDKVKYVSQVWNFQVNIQIYQQAHLPYYEQEYLNDYLAAKANPIIIHYSGSEKPWQNPFLFLHYKFWEIAIKSNFYTEILYEDFNEKLKLISNKNSINRKYLIAKILSWITFGRAKIKIKEERVKLKVKVRTIKNIINGDY